MIQYFGYVGKLFTDSYTRRSRKPLYLASGSIRKLSGTIQTAAMAHSYRAFASHSEVWMFEYQPRQSSATKRSQQV